MSFTINVNTGPLVVDSYNWANSANNMMDYTLPGGLTTISVNTTSNVITLNINGVILTAAYHTVNIAQNNSTSTFNCNVTTNNSPAFNAKVAYSNVVITNPLIALWPDPLPNGTVNTTYSYTLTATGGQPPYTFSITSGTLPNGLSLNATTGIISGTPVANINMDAVTFAVTDSLP